LLMLTTVEVEVGGGWWLLVAKFSAHYRKRKRGGPTPRSVCGGHIYHDGSSGCRSWANDR
jgi:hypothetical protein